ncbi:hypothetical protein [Spirosoma endbachense]|uniref:Uncharacterized protein n=1 Tax=Spirosoma endbachense TaxID=2666025 RepID=A0A6P1W3Q4_9BACT|nr:hypothetical protein [Spirosoma endbachense]QHV99524.1 hypothetical protein GJR95_32935 [Spirosoma endbachense]
MKTSLKHVYFALIGIAILSSCSRPVAYFQRGPVERYHTSTIEPAAVRTPAEITPSPAPSSITSDVTIPVASPTEQVVQAKQAVNQIEAYVRNDNKLASNRKLTSRIERVKSMLSSTSAKMSLASTPPVASKKMTLLERVAAKKINKKIQQKLSPEQPMATSMLTIGLIVAAAGLLLLLIGNGFGAVIGAIALVVGLVLILLELLKQ